jgi:hypothetical protein
LYFIVYQNTVHLAECVAKAALEELDMRFMVSYTKLWKLLH